MKKIQNLLKSLYDYLFPVYTEWKFVGRGSYYVEFSTSYDPLDGNNMVREVFYKKFERKNVKTNKEKVKCVDEYTFEYTRAEFKEKLEKEKLGEIKK